MQKNIEKRILKNEKEDTQEEQKKSFTVISIADLLNNQIEVDDSEETGNITSKYVNLSHNISLDFDYGKIYKFSQRNKNCEVNMTMSFLNIIQDFHIINTQNNVSKTILELNIHSIDSREFNMSIDSSCGLNFQFQLQKDRNYYNDIDSKMTKYMLTISFILIVGFLFSLTYFKNDLVNSSKEFSCLCLFCFLFKNCLSSFSLSFSSFIYCFSIVKFLYIVTFFPF